VIASRRVIWKKRARLSHSTADPSLMPVRSMRASSVPNRPDASQSPTDNMEVRWKSVREGLLKQLGRCFIGSGMRDVQMVSYTGNATMLMTAVTNC
jgi:hypothetical protein